jgi:hypothetical protein
MLKEVVQYVSKAMEHGYWVTQINTHDGLSIENIVQFYQLWEMLQTVHMDANTPRYNFVEAYE